MTKLGIVTGLAFEATLFAAAAEKTGQAAILVRCAGFGQEAARRAGQALVAQGCTALMSAGIAGGLDPLLAPGTVLVASDVRYSAALFPCDLAWTARLYEALAGLPAFFFPGAKVLRAPLAHVGTVLATAADKAALFAATGAAAADMESYGVAEVAAEQKLPFAALRIVADGATDAVPAVALAATTEAGGVRVGRTILGGLMNPGQIPSLIRLGLRTAVATRRLRDLANFGVARGFFADV